MNYQMAFQSLIKSLVPNGSFHTKKITLIFQKYDLLLSSSRFKNIQIKLNEYNRTFNINIPIKSNLNLTIVVPTSLKGTNSCRKLVYQVVKVNLSSYNKGMDLNLLV